MSLAQTFYRILLASCHLVDDLKNLFYCKFMSNFMMYWLDRRIEVSHIWLSTDNQKNVGEEDESIKAECTLNVISFRFFFISCNRYVYDKVVSISFLYR